MNSKADPPEAGTRPRVEGEREQQILDATLTVLAEVGYDRLTMDAVAGAAKASKATLYRRWSTKSELVIEALVSQKGAPTEVDTGTLRGDLLGMFCATGGLTDSHQTDVLGSVITAIGRDEEFAAAFRRDFIGPKTGVVERLFRRAQHRGEVHPDVDIALVAGALPGIVLHHKLLLGQAADESLVTRVLDQILLPAVAAGPHRPTTHPKETP